jgi:hypothetical protein
MSQPPNVPPQVVEALKRGDLMGAFKFLRQHYPQMGIGEVKALVDALQKQANVKAQGKAARAAAIGHSGMQPGHHTPHTAATLHIDPRLSPGEVPRAGSGSIFAAVIVAVMFVLGAAFYFGR